MNETHPTIDQIIEAFFSARLQSMAGLRRTRFLRAKTSLRQFLERGADDILTAQEEAIVASEREFRREDAFARTLHADALIAALPLWLEARWLAADLIDRGVQLQVADALAGYVLGHRYLQQGIECYLWQLRASIDDAHRELARERIRRKDEQRATAGAR
jgi:hypothetical protein